MNQSDAWKWTRRAVCALTLATGALCAVGCSPMNVLGFIFARPEKEPAKYPLTFDKDSPKKDKDEVVIALLPQVAPGNGPQFATTANELAEKVGRQLPEMAKENKDKHKVRVLSQAQVDKFKMKHPNWKKMSSGEIGKELGADFVLELWIDKLRLYQPNSFNAIYEGRAEVQVSIYEVNGEGSEQKDKYTLPFAYPRNGVRSADAIPESMFKTQFLEKLALEITKMHVDHRPSDSIAAE